MVVEERQDVRDASLVAWKTALSILAETPGRMNDTITQQHILEWYAMMMTPLGVPIDPSAFFHPSLANEGDAPVERHNVDKNMLAQDQSLITVEVTLRARVAAATAMSRLIFSWSEDVSRSLLGSLAETYLLRIAS